MSGCPAQTFTAVTQDQFDSLLQKAAAAGIPISGNSGSASQQGITISWNFDPVAQTLMLECTGKPFLIPCGTINSKIHDLVGGSQPTPVAGGPA
jgi:hypothetical protein